MQEVIMSESLKELEQQAAAIQKRIAALKCHPDSVVGKFIDDLQVPGTYINFCGSWIINPKGKFRQATCKSVEFSGDCVMMGKFAVPYIMEWNSGGYDVKQLRRMIESGEVKLYNDPASIKAAMKKSIKLVESDETIVELLLARCKDCPEDYDHGCFLRKSKTFVKYVLEHFDGLIFHCNENVAGTTQFNDNLTLDHLALFRVIDMGDGSHVIKCSVISMYNNQWCMTLNESKICTSVRLKTGADPYNKILARSIYGEIKNFSPVAVDTARKLYGMVKGRHAELIAETAKKVSQAVDPK